MTVKNSYLLMLVTYIVKPGLRNAFHQIILDEELQEASRHEPGNLAYDYFLSMDNPDELLLVEKWTDMKSLDEHRLLPHFLRLQALKNDYIKEVSVIRTEVN
jgi:quinol monooxygenase YgiN